VRRSRPFTIHPQVYGLVPSKLAASAHLVACPIVAYRAPPSTSSLNVWPVVPLATARDHLEASLREADVVLKRSSVPAQPPTMRTSRRACCQCQTNDPATVRQGNRATDCNVLAISRCSGCGMLRWSMS
jgi:hypothetical protein